jgi:single-strand DNA-binding protein
MTYQLITIVGNVGKDPEIKYLRDGIAVTDFTVAVSKVTGRGEQRKESTTWFRVTVWRERAETAAQLIKKGTRILVTGEVSASAFIDKKTGEARASLELTANEFRLLSSRAETQGGAGGGEYASEDGGGGSGNYNRGGGGNYSGGRQAPADDADEIPF